MSSMTPGALARILVVDDDQGIRDSLTEILEDEYHISSTDQGPIALDRIRSEEFDLVLLDLTMPAMSGIEVLKRIKEYDKSLEVIIVSATDKAREAIDAIKIGAYDYVTKPFDSEALLNLVARAIQKRALERELTYLRSEVSSISDGSTFISQAKCMQKIFSMIEKVAGTSSSVLIRGESGTGKELVARAIHAGSPRAGKPFVAINCAAIPAELIESELFGYEKGAFTGAVQRSIGKFEYANGGTIFLDELATLKPELQAQLLRFLQEREFTRVGSNRPIRVDVRVIAATNANLEAMVKEGRFRDDLYYRLNVIPIELPPLRERKGDVPLLADYFLKKFNKNLNKNISGFMPDAMAMLEAYPWPGNVRELENFIERLVVLGSDGQIITEKDLPFDLVIRSAATESDTGDNPDQGLLQARQTFERQFISRALQRAGWNQTECARQLKIHRNTLLKKLKELDIREKN